LHRTYVFPSFCDSVSFLFISITFLQAPPETQHEPMRVSLQATDAVNSIGILQGSQHGQLPTVNTDLSLKRLCSERRQSGCLAYIVIPRLTSDPTNEFFG